MAKLLVLLLCEALWQTVVVYSDTVDSLDPMWNSSDINKDMYVINAMVYQVGIVTNRTDHDNANATGSEEAFTFYHNNGSQVDLSKIPSPFLTNVTAQSLVAVAPIISSQDNAHKEFGWNSLNHLTNSPTTQNSEKGWPTLRPSMTYIRDVTSDQNVDNNTDMPLNNWYKILFKREASDSDFPMAVRNGSAIIPPAVGIESIAIPPLLMLNNNMSKIPVPIPYTSVIHYAKINTLVSKQ